MKAFFIGVIAIMLFAQIVGFGPVLKLLDPPENDVTNLLPPLRSPLYEPGERETAMAHVIYSKCSDAADEARRAQPNVSNLQTENGGYLECYITQMLENPKQLCDADTRNRLIRYTRGYFGLLANLKRSSEDPAQQPFIKMERDMERRQSTIEIGKDDFSPDPQIVEGWKTLVTEGAFAKDREFPHELKPEVPREIIDTLSAIKPGKAICS